MDIDANGVAKIKWSDTLNGTKRAADSTVTLPAALNVKRHVPDLERGGLHLQPAIGYVVTGTLNLSDQIYMRPRLSSSVARVP